MSETIYSQIAVIREAECIGCTKCIQACPVDAIIGASKQMHTVIADICTGCELCVIPCPVDCIDLIPVARTDPAELTELAEQSQQRTHQRELRLARQIQQKPADQLHQDFQQQTLLERQAAIQAAVSRAKIKKGI